MTVKELIAELEKADPDAEVYRCWYEINDSGTCWDTGDKVNYISFTPAFSGKYEKHGPRVEMW